MASSEWRAQLQRGVVIPAHPLALNRHRQLDVRRQRALSRYYLAAGAGGLAVGVHTTQFAIHEPRCGLLAPVWELAAEVMNHSGRPLVRVAGICGRTEQAVTEAALATDLGYHAGLLSLAAWPDEDEDRLIAHCQAVAQVIPLFGFYLQPSVGGRNLPYSFWSRFLDIPNIVAIKIAPFNRYQTLDVMRAVIASGRTDIALYTGNDDNIVPDLVTRYCWDGTCRNMVGGLLGHWSVWTRPGVELLHRCQREQPGPDLLQLGIEITDCNAAFFDAAHGFRGCIAGLHEVLRRQGLLEGVWCLDEHEGLSPGQPQEIDRVERAYPHLNDNAFVAEHLENWLRD